MAFSMRLRVALCALLLGLPACCSPALGAVATTPPASQRLAEAAARASSSSASAHNTIEAQVKRLEQQGPHRRTAQKSSRLSGAVLALAILAGALALGALLWAVLRFAAIEPHWLLSLRHSLAEAGFRASSIWSEFADWARLGH